MGKSRIVRNVVTMKEVFFSRGMMASRPVAMAWDSKTYGTPNVKNLERFVVAYIKSLKPGGINAHLCRDGVIPNISSANIRNQFTGAVCEWKAPMFFVAE